MAVFFADAFFNLSFYIALGIVELTYATTQSAHELRDLTTAKEDQHSKNDQDPLGAAGHVYQECQVVWRIHKMLFNAENPKVVFF